MIKAKKVKRQYGSLSVEIGVPILSIILAFVVSGLFLHFSGYDPSETFLRMFKGAFGSRYAISETIVKAVPLMLAGLAVSVAFRMKLWNIGAEGQLYMGAFAASWAALYCGGLSSWVLLPLMFLAGFAGGALWGFIPGFLRGYWQVNETIVTLMLNYVAISWVSFLVFGPWKDPASKGFPLTPRFSASGYLPTLGDSRVHLGLLIAVVIALILYLVLRYSRWGYEIKVIGESQNAARYAGMNVARNIVLVMVISGGIAGITGMIEVSGITHRLQQDISPGYGFTAVIVAWLARLHPFSIILVAFLFGALLVGGFGVQTFGIPYSIVLMLEGSILFFLLAGEFLRRYRIVLVRKEVS